MKGIALSLVFGALAASGIPSANAASVQPQPPVAVGIGVAAQPTDMSARRRYWRGPVFPRYYRGYGYYPQPYYYWPAAPVVSFGYGFGAPRFYRSRAHYHMLGVGY
jgi:hypothetical protein